MNRRFKLYSIGIFVALLCGWLVVLGFQARSDFNCAANCKSFASYEWRNPLCIVDAACVAPGYKGIHQPWHGPGNEINIVAYGEGLSLLALPNYCYFLVLMTALTALFEWKNNRLFSLLSLSTGLIVVLETLVWLNLVGYADPTWSWWSAAAAVFFLPALTPLLLRRIIRATRSSSS
jgi:hypothetical protein